MLSCYRFKTATQKKRACMTQVNSKVTAAQAEQTSGAEAALLFDTKK